MKVICHNRSSGNVKGEKEIYNDYSRRNVTQQKIRSEICTFNYFVVTAEQREEIISKSH